MSISWQAAGGTDVGRLREGNEDTFHVDAERGIFLVADGMGGHAAGEIASALATETVAGALAEALQQGVRDEALDEAMRAAVHLAHQRIVHCCQDDRRTRGMGTTLTACVLGPTGELRTVHIGDSRLYRLRDDRLEQLTRDHTWVQREVDAGRLTPAQARRHALSHILTRVLTDDTPPEVDLLTGELRPGDQLLLATDGLYNMLQDPVIATILQRGLPLDGCVQALIDAANQAGGADNITAVLVRVEERAIG